MKALKYIFLTMLVVFSCAPAATISTTKKYPPLPKTERIFVFGLNDATPTGSENLGTIKIGDSGLSVGCSFDNVVNLAREKARDVGGNAIKLLSVQEPDFGSTCYRISATILRLAKLDKNNLRRIATTESDLLKYFDTNSALQSIEGIWTTTSTVTMKSTGEKRLEQNNYEIAIIKRDFNNSRKYDAVIISSLIQEWNEVGLVKAEFSSTAYDNVYTVSWINANGTATSSTFTIDEDGTATGVFDDINFTNEFTLIKTYPKFSDQGKVSKGSISTGTGFLISQKGEIATNHHVIKDGKSIKVTFINSNGEKVTYKAISTLNDKNNDLSILRIEDVSFKELKSIPYKIESSFKVGEQVYTIGYPLSDVMGTNYKVTQGVVSSSSGIEDDIRFMQITAPIQPGNSGGPLFNSNGNIIGITTAQLNSEAVGVNIQNVNYAIKTLYLKTLLEMLPNYTPQTGTNDLINKKTEEQIEVLKNYVCLITVEN